MIKKVQGFKSLSVRLLLMWFVFGDHQLRWQNKYTKHFHKTKNIFSFFVCLLNGTDKTKARTHKTA